MADVLQMVDPAALATVRYDLNDYNGTSGTKLRAGVQTGDVESDNEILQQGAAATAINTEYPPVFVTLPVTVYGTSASNLRTKLRTLAREARRGGTLKRQLDSDSAALYRDFFPSNAPTLLNGELPEFQTLDNNVWQGTVTLLCQADWYAADATLANATSITNEVGDSEVKVTATGTEPSPVRVEMTVPEAAAEVVQVRFGTKNGTSANLTEFAGYYSFETDDPATDTTITFGSNTAKVDDVGNVSGDKYGRVSYTATGYFLKRFRKEIDPTTKAALAGEYKVFAMLRLTAASRQTVQLKWGMRDADPVDRVNDEVELDARTANGTPWVPVDLGNVKFDSEADVLVLELWSRLDDDPGSSTLDFDFVQLIPADTKRTTVSVLGFRSGQPARQRWLGEELTAPTDPAGLTGGTDNDTAKVLNAQNEAAGTKPNTGVVYPAGKVKVKALVTLTQAAGEARQKLGELRVRDITGTSNAITRDLYTKKNRAETDREIEAVFTADGTSAYQYQVVFTKSSPDTGEEIIVNELRSAAVRTVGNGDKIIVDPQDPDATGIWSGGVKVGDVLVGGAVPQVEPGDTTFVFQAGDWSGGAYQDDVTSSPLPKIIFDRQLTVTISETPHHSL